MTEPVTEPWGSYVQVTDPDGHQFVVSGAQALAEEAGVSGGEQRRRDT